MKRPVSEKDLDTHIEFIIDDNIDYDDGSVFPEFANWQPQYNLYTTPEGIMLHLELAGVDTRDIVIYLRTRHMIIMGNRTTPPGLTGDCCVFHNLEIPYGRFIRRIDFPIPIETRQHQHEMRDGLLTIHLKALEEKIIPIEGE
jgi:HSP20 family molecular chaperone IbpA